MENQGMTAVIRGLPDSSLVVTVLDAGRQYTLQPQDENHSLSTEPCDVIGNNAAFGHSEHSSRYVSAKSARRDIGAQAIDAQYASPYRVEYCHEKPTSPPSELTEFPPQRTHIHPGCENFEVGGVGSGGFYSARSHDSRSTLNWPCRDSSPTSRTSTKTDAFANSLRKYPSLSPERSSEVVERLTSFAKTTSSSRNNRSKFNEGITSCYRGHQPRNSSPKRSYRNNNSSKTKWSNEESPTRDIDSWSQEHNFLNCKHGQHFKNFDARFFNEPSENPMQNTNHFYLQESSGQADTLNIHRANIKTQTSDIMYNDTSQNKADKDPFTSPLLNIDISQEIPQSTVLSDLHPTNSYMSYQVITPSSGVLTTLSMVEYDTVLGNMKLVKICDENMSPSTTVLHSIPMRDVESTQTTKSLISVKIKNRYKCCFPCHLLRNKTKRINKQRFNCNELFNLTRQHHISKREEKLDNKIKRLVCKVLDISLDHRKRKRNMEKILKHISKIKKTEKSASNKLANNNIDNCKYNNMTRKEALTNSSKIIDIVWKKCTKRKCINKSRERFPQGHYIINEKLFDILEYQAFKKQENKVLKIILTKLIKDIVDILTEIKIEHLGNRNNALEYHEIYDIINKICSSQKLFSYLLCYVKKYQRFFKALRKSIKNESLYILDKNKNLFKKTKKPIDLKFKNINVNYVFKKIQSSSKFPAKYVTKMLLNQYCTRKNEYVYENSHQKVRNTTNLLILKCLSDTYLWLHDSSQNKSILTRKKIDKMNLCSSTKLLSSIKKKSILEERNIFKNKRIGQQFFECYNSPQKCGVRIFSDNNSSIPISMVCTNNQYIKINKNNLELKPVCFLQKIEEKVNMCLMKYGIDVLQINNKYPESILKNLTKDITDQLKLLIVNQTIYTIKNDSIADYLKYLIYKHFFIVDDDRSFELVQKVSELVQELINISMSHASEKIKLNNHSLIPPNNIEKTNIAKKLNPMPSSSVSQTSNIIKDIYSRAAFCDENIGHAHSGQKDIDINQNETCVLQNQTQIEQIRNRSGFINVAIASTNENSDLGSPRNLNNNSIKMRDMATSSRSDRESTVIRSNNIARPSHQERGGFTEPPEGMTREELHEYYVQVFRNHCKELPILAITTDLAELAREGVLHNIIKLFFMLKEDPDIENDYTYFEFCLEDDIDGLLDLLPQTEEMKKMREGWKIKVVMHATQMLKYIHKIEDDTQFKIKLNQVLNRRRLIQENTMKNNEAQQLNALRIAEIFLMSTNYQEQNPLKLKIYMQRLINHINQVYNMIKKREGKSFLLLPIDKINDVIYDDLKNIPIPNDDITKEEIDLVQLNDEIEKWYNELPVEPAEGFSALKRKILTLSLSKKIHEMEKHMDLNEPSFERNMKHEISKFLSMEQAGLERDEDLNINFMVEELANRLRRIRQEKMLDYESFSKHLPVSSTIVQHEPSLNQDNVLQSIEEVQFNGHNQLSNSHEISRNTNSLNTNEENIIKLKPIARSTAKGVLGTNQLPGPSTRKDHIFSSVCGPKACQSKSSPKTASLFTPSSSSLTRNTCDAGQFHGINEIDYTSPTQSTPINTNRGANNGDIRFNQLRQQKPDDFSIRDSATRHDVRFNQLRQQIPDDFSIRESATRHTNEPNDYIPIARQEDGRLPSIGHTHGTPPTANVAPGIPQYGSGNDFKRDFINTLHLDSERDREQNRTRCRCADGVLRRRKRFMCCCEKYISIPYCCLYPFPYDHFL